MGSKPCRHGDSPDPAWLCVQVEERSLLNRQNSPALQHKVANRISDPSLPPRSESFSSSGIQAVRTPPMHRQVEPPVSPAPCTLQCAWSPSLMRLTPVPSLDAAPGPSEVPQPVDVRLPVAARPVGSGSIGLPGGPVPPPARHTPAEFRPHL